jgi:hypothetical protein
MSSLRTAVRPRRGKKVLRLSRPGGLQASLLSPLRVRIRGRVKAPEVDEQVAGEEKGA